MFIRLDLDRIRDPGYRTVTGARGEVRLSIKQRVLLDVASCVGQQPIRVNRLSEIFQDTVDHARSSGIFVDEGKKTGFSPNALSDQFRQIEKKLPGVLEFSEATKNRTVRFRRNHVLRWHS